MNTWPALSAPVFGGDNFRLAQQMSAMTKDGELPDFRAVLYAVEQSPQEPIANYADRRGV